ncbi:hypothetical protein [Amycolatopsis sp. CA-128772]|uniref:hypothetical protein n=1 Tax=Amycolatopsis sp. CA-128772 TaxID=2073159 RepID=UPI000CD31948|nr:hypothetical protein [Amycolatopsis sp. CA-128772]
MSLFSYYSVWYTIDGVDELHTAQCSTVLDETTTDDFPAMIGARLWGSAEDGNTRVTVVRFSRLAWS